MKDVWIIRSTAFTGAGLAWLASNIIDQPPPLWVPFVALGLAFACVYIAALKKSEAEGKTE